MFLEQELQSLVNCLDKHQWQAPGVSKASVGWHIDHSLRVVIGMAGALIKSDPRAYKWRYNLTRSVVLMAGFMPRGKGVAPAAVVAGKPVTREGIVQLMAEARKRLQKLENLAAKANFNHPYFGQLNLWQTKRLIRIHSNHHLKIIKDIVAAVDKTG